ncbi:MULTISPECIES: MraY family glycosyltransferase [Maribacter]|uniref:MraY family glycosyltransferase n=1 Tax=Maribacter flavus TaxID=1658664 RepID=A0ABU7IMK0_9FLAO|nr:MULTISPECIES: MraY family glycosyltransferase [Maribacter]MDC6407033.1 MraY family glycosyltransferase [Maribacter sp. PR66]MEE1974182.1 MraY family glycosyltransferase [Maribacter flavus]
MPNNMIDFLSNYVYLSLIAGFAAFFLSSSIYLYPVIINVSKLKGLMDDPDHRKMHVSKTPNLGGLGIFLAFSLSIIVFGILTDLVPTDLAKLLAIMGSSIILVFLGIKDDLTGMAPKKKLIGQLIAVLNVVVLTDIRILHFGGIFGLNELPYIASVLFSIFVFMLVINAFNLVDGIDGLAGSLSILGSITFGILFSIKGNYLMSLVATIFVGSVLGFLKYNLSRDKKIFMGDCGSLLTGFLLAYQGIYFLNLNMEIGTTNSFTNSPVILLAIFSYPLFDLLRVFAIRIREGRSPFSADSNHIHHQLLRIGLSHKKSTFTLVIANSLVIAFAFLTMQLNVHVHLVAAVLFGAFIYLLPFLKVFGVKNDALSNASNTGSGLMNGSASHEVTSLKDLAASDQNKTFKSNLNGMSTKSNGQYNGKEFIKDRTKTFNTLKGKLRNRKNKALDKDSVL